MSVFQIGSDLMGVVSALTVSVIYGNALVKLRQRVDALDTELAHVRGVAYRTANLERGDAVDSPFLDLFQERGSVNRDYGFEDE